MAGTDGYGAVSTVVEFLTPHLLRDKISLVTLAVGIVVVIVVSATALRGLAMEAFFAIVLSVLVAAASVFAWRARTLSR